MSEGYTIEKVVDGLTYPTSVAWDDDGMMYVAEAGGQFLEEPPPSRIMPVDSESGAVTEFIDLFEEGMTDPIGEMTWFDGAFHITHRDADDRSGADSRVSPDGDVTRLFRGFIDSQSEHPLSDIQPRPDGRLYFADLSAFADALLNGLSPRGPRPSRHCSAPRRRVPRRVLPDDRATRRRRADGRRERWCPGPPGSGSANARKENRRVA